MLRTCIIVASLLCGSVAFAPPIRLTQEAIDLTREALLVDGHNDLPWALRSAGDFQLRRYDLRRRQSRFHTDIPRLREGGMDAQFWSVYVPASRMDVGDSYEMTMQQIDLVKRMVEKYPDTFQLALSTDDIRAAKAAGKIASMIGVEGGHAIEDSLEKLDALYAAGARYMTITHSRSLRWADSATDRARSGGISDFGRQVIRRMNDLGMLVDISHVSASAMRQILEVSRAPVIASHSSAYAITRHARNVPDDVLATIAEKRGIVMVNFYSDFIVPKSDELGDLFHAGCNHEVKAFPAPTDFVYTQGPRAGTDVVARGDVDTLLDHIDHIVRIAGIDSVGLGSDYDGVPTLPQQLEDVSKYPYVTQGLLSRGYSHDDIRKILGENLMRVFKEVEEAATKKAL